MNVVKRADDLTVGDVARRLSVDIDTVVKLVYDGDLEGQPDPSTGRLFVRESALEAFEARRPTNA